MGIIGETLAQNMTACNNLEALTHFCAVSFQEASPWVDQTNLKQV
jgi:hypothetical protein